MAMLLLVEVLLAAMSPMLGLCTLSSNSLGQSLLHRQLPKSLVWMTRLLRPNVGWAKPRGPGAVEVVLLGAEAAVGEQRPQTHRPSTWRMRTER